MRGVVSSIRLSKALCGQEMVVCFLDSEEGIMKDVILTRS
jgi:hypothetical protein